MGIYSINQKEFIQESTKIMNNVKHDANWVRVYQENDKYCISGKELLEYMSMSGIFDIEEAVDNIKESNAIYNDNIIVNLDECDEFQESLIREETNIICEKSVVTGSSDLEKEKQLYKKFIKKMKKTNKSDTKKEIESRIKFLNNCVEKMKKEVNSPDKKIKNRIKYGLKAFIPFNYMYRYSKSSDKSSAAVSSISWFCSALVALGTKNPIAYLAVKPTEVAIRIMSYKKMVKQCIKDTEDAIEYLEIQLKKLED